MAPQGDYLLTLPEVMEILKVSEGTVRAMIRSGKIPKGRKVHGTAVRWFRSDIDGYLYKLRNDADAKVDADAPIEDEE